MIEPRPTTWIEFWCANINKTLWTIIAVAFLIGPMTSCQFQLKTKDGQTVEAGPH